MSWSFSASGTLAEARITVKGAMESYSGCDPAHGHSVRMAKAAINAEIDHIEATGGTYVAVSANGHSDAKSRYYTINVSRDTESEKLAADKLEAQAKSAWRDQGMKHGWLGGGSGSAEGSCGKAEGMGVVGLTPDGSNGHRS